MVEKQELPSRREVRVACQKIDSFSELAMDVLTNLSEFYIEIEEMQKSMRVSNGMEKIDDEYNSAYEAANEYLQSR